MGVRFGREKRRQWLVSIAYKLNAFAPLSLRRKLHALLDLNWISWRLAHESATRLKLDQLAGNDFLYCRIRSEDAILDLGCSSGQMTNKLAGMARQVVGVDHSGEKLALARSAYPGIEFVECDAQQYLDDSGTKFDVLIMSHVLEHLDHPDAVLRLAHRFERTYVEVPDFDAFPLNSVRQHLGRELIYSDNDHVAEYDRDEMADLIGRAGLEIDAAEYRYGVMKYWLRPSLGNASPA